MNVLCALKLTELWNTSLLFDLHHKFINGSLAFSPGLIYISLYVVFDNHEENKFSLSQTSKKDNFM